MSDTTVQMQHDVTRRLEEKLAVTTQRLADLTTQQSVLQQQCTEVKREYAEKQDQLVREMKERQEQLN